MLIKYHEPLGDPNKKQHPLPRNLRDLASKAGKKPEKFAEVEKGKLYRSGIVWPHQVIFLQENYGITHLISLLEGDWLKEFYDNKRITIHQFPYHTRKALTTDGVKDIVDVINELDEPAIVFCLKGVTKTGKVCAGYKILNGKDTNLACVLEYVRYSDFFLGAFNISTVKEILKYSR